MVQSSVLMPQLHFCTFLCHDQTQKQAGKPHLHPATSSLPPATQEHCALCVVVQPNIKPQAEVQDI